MEKWETEIKEIKIKDYGFFFLKLVFKLISVSFLTF